MIDGGLLETLTVQYQRAVQQQDEARLILQRFADAGEPVAMILFGGLLWPEEPERATVYLERAGPQCPDTDEFLIGATLLMRLSRRREPLQILLGPLADKANGQAQELLGLLWNDENYGPPDFVRARTYLQEAANRRREKAYTPLAFLCLGGLGGPRDEKAAQYWLRKAYYDNDDAEASCELGNWAARLGDMRVARNFWHFAAQRGSVLAQSRLGQFLLSGKPGRGTVRRGEQWLERAAGGGDIEAMTLIGRRYSRRASPQRERAVAYLQMAATAGHAPAQHALVRLYASGRGVARDFQQARHWFQRAVAAGHPISPGEQRRFENLKD